MVGDRIVDFQVIDFVEVVVKDRLKYVTIKAVIHLLATLPGMKTCI